MKTHGERLEKFRRTTLYPVITPQLCGGRPVLDVLEEVLSGGAGIVQLRDKSGSPGWAAPFREATRRYGALLIINDSLETALAGYADGVHLGQQDLPVREARRRAPDLLIGASCHNLSEALAAQAAGASYVNIGPIFPTATKKNLAEVLGPGAIAEIAPRLAVPFTVMGGINMENIDLVLAAGARHIAMVTALTLERDARAVTRLFLDKIAGCEPAPAPRP